MHPRDKKVSVIATCAVESMGGFAHTLITHTTGANDEETNSRTELPKRP